LNGFNYHGYDRYGYDVKGYSIYPDKLSYWEPISDLTFNVLKFIILKTLFELVEQCSMLNLRAEDCLFKSELVAMVMTAMMISVSTG
jgi:hypothetical protein